MTWGGGFLPTIDRAFCFIENIYKSLLRIGIHFIVIVKSTCKKVLQVIVNYRSSSAVDAMLEILRKDIHLHMIGLI